VLKVDEEEVKSIQVLEKLIEESGHLERNKWKKSKELYRID